MGSCLCTVKQDFANNSGQLAKVISDSYIPPVDDNIEVVIEETNETQIKPDAMSAEKKKNALDLAPITAQLNNHIKLNKNGVGIQLNHFSPFPGSSTKKQPLQSFDLLSIHSQSNPINTLSAISDIDNNSNIALTPNSITSPDNINCIYHDEEKVNKYTGKQIDFASGAFAHVFISNMDDHKVAIKKIEVDKSDNMDDALYSKWSNKTLLKDAETELNILKQLNKNGHINIIKLIDNFYETTAYNDLYLYLIMDFIETSLDKEIIKYANNGENIPNELIKIYSFQILNGLNYMKMMNVIHRDLKPENILIDPITNVIKICDFGCSKLMIMENGGEITEKMENYVCSRYYRAPELILESGHYSYSIDVWSFGCIFSEMYLGQIMFDGDNTQNQLIEIVKILGIPTRYDLNEMNKEYQYDRLLDELQEIECDKPRDWRFLFIGIDNISKDFIDLIDKILIYAPNDRLIPIDCMKHDFFDGLCDDEDMLKEYNVPIDAVKLNQ